MVIDMAKKKKNKLEVPKPLWMVNEFSKDFPDAWSLYENIYSYGIENGMLAKTATHLPVPICKVCAEQLHKDQNRPFNPNDTDTISLLYTLGAWRRYKKIYTIDPEFANMLMESESCDIIPADVLRNMPFNAMYIAIDGENISNYVGFFVVFDSSNDINNPCDAEDMQIVTFIALTQDNFMLSIPLIVQEGMSLGDAINMISDITKSANKGKDEFALARKCIPKFMQLLLYICAANADTQERPNRHKRTSTQSTTIKTRDAYREIDHVDVGYRIGAVIRNSNPTKEGSIDNESVASKHGSHKPKRPHVRRGHFHHFWAGSKSDDSRKLVLKWVAPAFINSSIDDLDAVIHKVKN